MKLIGGLADRAALFRSSAADRRSGIAAIPTYFAFMPYEWTTPAPDGTTHELCLWPYRSLLQKDFVLFFGSTALIVGLPLIVLLGSPVLWGILPFFGLMLWGLWFALRHSYRSGSTLETLTLTKDTVKLTRQDPGKPAKMWETNIYWASVDFHLNDGPVEYYLTLGGGDRTVEIGAFLSVEERKALFGELKTALQN